MIEVRIPTSPAGLRIRHFNSMSLAPVEGFKDWKDSILFLSDFLGRPYNTILDFKAQDIKTMTTTIVKAMSKMDLSAKLPERITLGEKEFVLVNPEKVGIGWHIDFQHSDVRKDPVGLTCLFYVPEGFNYSDVDENGNITHTIDSRRELFDKEFPLDLFIRSADFFLRLLLNSTKKSMVRKIAADKTQQNLTHVIQNLSRFSGRQR